MTTATLILLALFAVPLLRLGRPLPLLGQLPEIQEIAARERPFLLEGLEKGFAAGPPQRDAAVIDLNFFNKILV